MNSPRKSIRLFDERGNLRTMAALELEIITIAVKHCSGEKTTAARKLGIGKTTIFRRLKGAA